jgi:hypothetical protein
LKIPATAQGIAKQESRMTKKNAAVDTAEHSAQLAAKAMAEVVSASSQLRRLGVFIRHAATTVNCPW